MNGRPLCAIVMTKIVCITGPIGSGKTHTMAAVMADRHLPGGCHVSIAEPLRTLVMRGGKSEPCVGCPSLSNGRVMQLVGQGVRDIVHPDFWINMAIAFIKRKMPSWVMIDDLRYDNEYDALVAAFGVENVRVYATGRPMKQTCLAGRDAAHRSEAGLSARIPVSDVSEIVLFLDTSF
jgi:hypothetical protein